MNIFVCVKQIPDARSIIIPNNEKDSIATENLRWDINPEDECAVEQALQIRDQFPQSTITVVRIGEKQNSEALITAMAMGADRAILVETTEKELDPYLTAKALKGAIDHNSNQPDLILCGTESFGDESALVPQLIAQLFNFPCISKASKCEIQDNTARLERRVEGGVTELYKLCLPAVIACNYGINIPRYASFPHIQDAYKKPLIELNLKDIGLSVSNKHLHYTNIRPTKKKKTGKVLYANDNNQVEKVAQEIVTSLNSSSLLISTDP